MGPFNFFADALTASFLLCMAGSIHGSAFFSLPGILALPLLVRQDRPEKKSFSMPVAYTAIFLTLFLSLAVAYASLRVLGYSLNFSNINGIATESRLVVFRPLNDLAALRNQVFLEPGYILERGWVFLVSFPLLFLFLFRRNLLFDWWREAGTILFFLYAIGPVAISLLWDLDFGIQDFDLYTAPMTLFNLFLLRLLVLKRNHLVRPSQHLLLLALFGLTSPLPMLLFSTLQK